MAVGAVPRAVTFVAAALAHLGHQRLQPVARAGERFGVEVAARLLVVGERLYKMSAIPCRLFVRRKLLDRLEFSRTCALTALAKERSVAVTDGGAVGVAVGRQPGARVLGRGGGVIGAHVVVVPAVVDIDPVDVDCRPARRSGCRAQHGPGVRHPLSRRSGVASTSRGLFP